MNPAELRLEQMDAALKAERLAALPERPIGGWLRAIRQALGIPSAGVAARLGITASGLRKLEQAEASDAITLATLRRAAEALDCELRYVLVPRQPLREMRRQQALARARSWLERSRPWPRSSCAPGGHACGTERCSPLRRHARLMADVLIEQLGQPRFFWGGSTPLVDSTTLRSRYITALQQADRGDLEPLLSFARAR